MKNSVVIMGYVILAAYLIGMLVIGFLCRKKYTDTVSGFFAGGKKLGPWVFALTYGSTYLSSSTFIGNTGTAYSGGMAYLFMPLAQVLSLPLGLIIFSHMLRKMSKTLDVVTNHPNIKKSHKSPVA